MCVYRDKQIKGFSTVIIVNKFLDCRKVLDAILSNGHVLTNRETSIADILSNYGNLVSKINLQQPICALHSSVHTGTYLNS